VRQLLVAASVVPSSPILVTLMKEALGSSETSVLTFFIVTAVKASNLTLSLSKHLRNKTFNHVNMIRESPLVDLSRPTSK
jgi:hypothetical protein